VGLAIEILVWWQCSRACVTTRSPTNPVDLVVGSNSRFHFLPES
jgi:hypothetical protein